jgi:Predicted dehydrogenases and related proteins
MDKIRLGIIGFGNQGGAYSELLQAGRVKNMELGAICDISPEKRRLAQEKYPEVPFFEDYIEMIESGTVNAVVTTVPHYLHPEMGMEAIKRDMPVICEKPAGVYTKQVIELNELALSKPQVPFAIMFNQRSNPLYIEIKKIMDSKEIGELRRTNWISTNWWRPQSYYDQSSWRATWGAEGGGVLVNQAPHQLDLIQWLCGQPTEVYADIICGCHRDIAVENEVTAVMNYENGATGVFTTCTHDVMGTDRLEIVGDKGKIVIEDSKRAIVRILKESEPYMNEHYTMMEIERLVRGDGTSTAELYTERIIEFDSVWGGQHCSVLENFADHILTGTPLLAPGTDGIQGVQLANAMILSGWQKKKVSYNFDADEFIEELNKHIAKEGIYPLINN